MEAKERLSDELASLRMSLNEKPETQNRLAVLRVEYAPLTTVQAYFLDCFPSKNCIPPVSSQTRVRHRTLSAGLC